MENQDIKASLIKSLWSQIHVQGHIIGVATGSGMTTKYAVAAGADLIFALSAGRFRMMGRSSHGCYLCFANSNQMVKDFASHELLTVFQKNGIIFGYNATDPTFDMKDFFEWIKNSKFAGIVNYPSICIIDGQFREALEEEGVTYKTEVEAIRLASKMGMFAVAFVASEQQAEWMLDAGADMICVHLGLTKGGILGAKKLFTLDRARALTSSVFKLCEKRRPEVFRMVYGGPIETPIDMKYIFDNTNCHGYIGGSAFEREPVERALYNTTLSFKGKGDFSESNKYYKILTDSLEQYDYVTFIKEYIDENYMNSIQLDELAMVLHVNQSYLSTLFKKKMGISFTDYLIQYRMNRASDLLKSHLITVKGVAESVGYPDCVQFSKIFKKHLGESPGVYQKKYKKAD